MRLIGLTGGIGTGKTTVSNYLARIHNLPVWDADIYARQAVEPNSPVLGALVDRYGSDLLLPDGSLNRPVLGNIIFNNLTERRWVEAQIHPFVRDRFRENCDALRKSSSTGEPTAVLAVPLLFEAEMTDLATEIWVVYCSPEQQKCRLIGRHGASLTPEQIRARIESQMSLEEKCRRADVVLDNSSTLEDLYRQCDRAVNSSVGRFGERRRRRGRREK